MTVMTRQESEDLLKHILENVLGCDDDSIIARTLKYEGIKDMQDLLHVKIKDVPCLMFFPKPIKEEPKPDACTIDYGNSTKLQLALYWFKDMYVGNGCVPLDYDD